MCAAQFAEVLDKQSQTLADFGSVLHTCLVKTDPQVKYHLLKTLLSLTDESGAEFLQSEAIVELVIKCLWDQETQVVTAAQVRCEIKHTPPDSRYKLYGEGGEFDLILEGRCRPTRAICDLRY